jgi:hypothetical protein
MNAEKEKYKFHLQINKRIEDPWQEHTKFLIWK